MEYDLHRKKKITSVLKASPYTVHDRVEFAELTKRFSKDFKEKVTNPLHFEICWGSPFKLQHVTTILKVQVPSVESLETERILERQRLEKSELQHKVSWSGQTKLKSKVFLERRPLPPSGFH
ncbi:uncharacterized protein C4orf36 homolog [Thamnophis elegans]|uniref:uncharacterized protein C4orf36 homolog n=1 Tax=Thamnophis elegans TaxID=35005 RepID=UPI001376FDE9|nr:uncharacterized protein C4orf36 homolog [Thamnophis elegans]